MENADVRAPIGFYNKKIIVRAENNFFPPDPKEIAYFDKIFGTKNGKKVIKKIIKKPIKK